MPGKESPPTRYALAGLIIAAIGCVATGLLGLVRGSVALGPVHACQTRDADAVDCHQRRRLDRRPGPLRHPESGGGPPLLQRQAGPLWLECPDHVACISWDRGHRELAGLPESKEIRSDRGQAAHAGTRDHPGAGHAAPASNGHRLLLLAVPTGHGADAVQRLEERLAAASSISNSWIQMPIRCWRASTASPATARSC